MPATLQVIAGPLKDKLFPIDADSVSLGRDPANEIALQDTSVSRRHCSITRENGRFVLRDNGSHNGTIVNGTPKKQHSLQHGDQVAIGNTIVRFLATDEPALQRSAVATGDTLQVNLGDSLYGALQSGIRGDAPPQRLARDLSTLLRVATNISAINDVDSLAWQLLGLLFDIVPADRAAILLHDPKGELIAQYAWNRLSGPAEEVQVSRTIVGRVREEGVALLSRDVPNEDSLSKVPSVAAAGIHSVLCVPLIASSRKLGVLYVDTTNPHVRIDDSHLQLLLGIGGIAALAFENCRRFEALEDENRVLRASVPLHHDMVGSSAAMQQVYSIIAKVAPTDSTVLITGESGTGKELAARALHANSGRKDKPFVAINCAALTETLLESELFGYEKGAFTGAISQKKGLLEAAAGGTVFLDEISELAPNLQAKMLRVLQERELVRVGGTKPLKIDVRLIAATNRDLAAEAASGKFRQDLFYRLNVVSMRMPALRERKEDIASLADHFRAVCGTRCKRRVGAISAEALRCLQEYDWPGNVREMENAIERAVVLGSSDTIMPEDLPEPILEAEPAESVATSSGKYHESVIALKKELIQRAVEQANGSYVDAAKILGVHPNYLHRLIRNLNLKSTLKKAGG